MVVDRLLRAILALLLGLTTTILAIGPAQGDPSPSPAEPFMATLDAKVIAELESDSLLPERFAAIVVQEAKRRCPACVVRLPEKLQMTVGTELGVGMDINLENAWLSCKEDKKRRVLVVQRVVGSIPSTPVGFAEDNPPPYRLDDLVVVVRSKANMDAYVSSLKQAYPSRPLAGDLVEMLALDLPDKIAYVSERELTGLTERSWETLRTRGLANLLKRLPKLEFQQEGPVVMIIAGGVYESSLLLHDELWIEVGKRVQGNIVAAVPVQDCLVATGADSPVGIETVKSVAARLFQEAPHAVSPSLIERRDGKWYSFTK